MYSKLIAQYNSLGTIAKDFSLDFMNIPHTNDFYDADFMHYQCSFIPVQIFWNTYYVINVSDWLRNIQPVTDCEPETGEYTCPKIVRLSLSVSVSAHCPSSCPLITDSNGRFLWNRRNACFKSLGHFDFVKFLFLNFSLSWL